VRGKIRRMKTLNPSRIDAAETFVWLSGRLLERLRFACLFRNGDRERAIAALRVYQNADGGFGEALEPDFRGPVSQPGSAWQAAKYLDELDAFHDPMAQRLCDYLTSITTREGGVPMVLSDVVRYPHPPWWAPSPGEQRASLLPTAALAGYLYKHRVDHPWLKGATEFCWNAIDGLLGAPVSGAYGYVIKATMTFLDHVPDRARAKEVAARIGRRGLEAKAIALDPNTSGEVHFPLDFASEPTALARAWFDDALIERHLDALVDAQQQDGGWQINWTVWTPLAGLEWRAWQTIDRLKTLRAYGRLSSR
jgi:hypothetical protein